MKCACLVERTKDASMMGKFCTLIFVVLWFMELCALILAHQGISAVTDPIKNLPKTVVDGFNNELGIGALESGMQTVQEEAESVLRKCKVDEPAFSQAGFASACEAISSGGIDPTAVNADTANADVEKAAIVKAFEAGLYKAQKVVNDDYFGMPDMAAAAEGLNNITKQLDAAEGGDVLCTAQNIVYCGMRAAAISTSSQVQIVKDTIDGFTDNDQMDIFKEQIAPRLGLMHVVPYVFILSLALFTCFWASESAGACFASKPGVVAYIFHFIFGWVGNAVAILVVGIYLALGPGADRINIPDGTLATNGANLQILKDHVKEEFNELWIVLFEPFGVAGGKIGNAFMVFLGVGIVTIIYGIVVCIVRPYKKKAADGDTAK